MADSTPITPPGAPGDGRPAAKPHGTGGETAFDAHLPHAHHHAGHHAGSPHHAGGPHHAPAHQSPSQQSHGNHFHTAHHAHAARRAHLMPLSEPVRAAIGQAIHREGVPLDWREGLEFIAAGESGGEVGATNPHSSARGLFQLTRANYQYNPNGEASFGNPVEEAQGGIRYILDRYGDIAPAVSTWQKRRAY